MVITRKRFIRQSACVMAGYILLPKTTLQSDEKVVAVNGPIATGKMGFTLSHEHILVDFIGAGKIAPGRYHQDEVFKIALPKLMAAKEKGCQTLVECTPAWLGRDVMLLRRLSSACGLNIVTNTGYYAAAGEKYLPLHAYTETAEQIAARWIHEWENGIDGTGIKPGFIKSGVDKYPLTAVQRKLVEAAAFTHLATGLSIAIHSGDGLAALAELQILEAKGVHPAAWIWVHAQNEKSRIFQTRAAKTGGWISYDGVSTGSIAECLNFLKDMKQENLLEHILLSQDSGWYHVGEPNGGEYNDYNTIADKLLPAMKENGFTANDILQIFTTNPARAFAVKVRKK